MTTTRRSFLSALGLAPLAAWLSSRVSAAPALPRYVDHELGVFDTDTGECVEPRVEPPLRAWTVPQLREWSKVMRIGVVCQPGASTGECWILRHDDEEA